MSTERLPHFVRSLRYRLFFLRLRERDFLMLDAASAPKSENKTQTVCSPMDATMPMLPDAPPGRNKDSNTINVNKAPPHSTPHSTSPSSDNDATNPPTKAHM